MATSIPYKLNIIYVGLVLLIITPVLFIHMLCDLQLFNKLTQTTPNTY